MRTESSTPGTFCTRGSRAAAVLALALSLAAPAAAAGQIGAIGAGASSALTGEDLYEAAPVMYFSALVLPRRAWSANLTFNAAGFDFSFPDATDPVSGDFHSSGLAVAAFYGLATRLTVGASLQAYTDFSQECNICRKEEGFGLGDVSLWAVYQLWRSPTGRTKLAGIGRIAIPTGDNDVGLEGVRPDVGLTVTHNTPRVTVNGGVSAGFPSDSLDGENYYLIDAALVFPLRRDLAVSVEGGYFGFDGEHVLQVGPGLRFRADRQLVLDAGLQLVPSTSIENRSREFAVVVGATFVR